MLTSLFHEGEQMDRTKRESMTPASGAVCCTCRWFDQTVERFSTGCRGLLRLSGQSFGHSGTMTAADGNLTAALGWTAIGGSVVDLHERSHTASVEAVDLGD